MIPFWHHRKVTEKGVIMEIILLSICLAVSLLNFVLLIGIAGSVVKLIGYLGEEDEVLPRREVNELSDREPFYDGVAPRPPNSDGAGGVIED